MKQNKNYAVWNNKAVAGKKFLTFAITTAIAAKLEEEKDPRKILVIDMCPQAKTSEIFLGGNGDGNGNGSEKLIDTFISPQKTIAGYFEKRTYINPFKKLGTEKDYIAQISQHREKPEDIPSNMYLIAGDWRLELLKIPTADTPQQQWTNDLIGSAKSLLGEDLITFIDCHPSFSIYVEKGLASSKAIIVPFSEDGFSPGAILNLDHMPDSYSIGLLINHLGIPLSKMCEKHTIDGIATTIEIEIEKEQKDKYNKALDEIIDKLGLF